MDVASENIISFTSFFEVECFIFCFLVLLFFLFDQKGKDLFALLFFFT